MFTLLYYVQRLLAHCSGQPLPTHNEPERPGLSPSILVSPTDHTKETP